MQVRRTLSLIRSPETECVAGLSPSSLLTRSATCSFMLRGPVSALLNPSVEESKPCLCHRISCMKLTSPPISGSRLPRLRCPQCVLYQTVPERSWLALVWYFKTFYCFETLPFEGWCAVATPPDYESSLQSRDWQCANPDKFLSTPNGPLTSCFTCEFLCVHNACVWKLEDLGWFFPSTM